MLIPFEEYIEHSNRAKTVDELVQVFLDTVSQHGMDRMIFCLLSEHKKIGLEAGVGHLRNYPDGWMDFYFEQGFDKIDPVISYCYQRLGTFTWEEMAERLNLTRDQKKCLNMGIDAGLHHGICTPLYGPQRFAGIGLASSNQKDNFDGRYDLITAYCNHFYLAFQRLYEKEQGQEKEEENIYLTPKEREVLLWAARGKSSNDIGDIMTLSEAGVNFHLTNIYKKLNANSRILAITKAISLGLINP